MWGALGLKGDHSQKSLEEAAALEATSCRSGTLWVWTHHLDTLLPRTTLGISH